MLDVKEDGTLHILSFLVKFITCDVCKLNKN